MLTQPKLRSVLKKKKKTEKNRQVKSSDGRGVRDTRAKAVRRRRKNPRRMSQMNRVGHGIFRYYECDLHHYNHHRVDKQ